MSLRRADDRPLVIGHRGAKAIAPENTLASLDAAIAAGADYVEFDVSPGLVLGHSELELASDPASLDDALDLLRAHGRGAHVDLKLPGYERDACEAVRRHGLEQRALISTTWRESARRLAQLAPDLPRAIGYPRDRYGVSRFAWPTRATRLGAAALRFAMPVRAPLLLRSTRANTLSLHHALCSRATVAAAHRLGAPVLAWTANEPAIVRRLAEAGVDGIVSDDPGMALATLIAL